MNQGQVLHNGGISKGQSSAAQGIGKTHLEQLVPLRPQEVFVLRIWFLEVLESWHFALNVPLEAKNTSSETLFTASPETDCTGQVEAEIAIGYSCRWIHSHDTRRQKSNSVASFHPDLAFLDGDHPVLSYSLLSEFCHSLLLVPIRLVTTTTS